MSRSVSLQPAVRSRRSWAALLLFLLGLPLVSCTETVSPQLYSVEISVETRQRDGAPGHRPEIGAVLLSIDREIEALLVSSVEALTYESGGRTFAALVSTDTVGPAPEQITFRLRFAGTEVPQVELMEVARTDGRLYPDVEMFVARRVGLPGVAFAEPSETAGGEG